jgi:hypothetical protein
MMPAMKHDASADGEKREWHNNSNKQVIALTSTLFDWKMSHPLLSLFFISLAVDEAFFCGPALLVSSFAATRVHRVKKMTLVFCTNPDGNSEIEKIQKLLEYQAAEIKEKGAENLNLMFEGIKKEIRTSTEGLKYDIDALRKDLNTSTKGLKKDIKGLNKKFHTLNIIIIVIGCATFLEKILHF